MISMKSSTAAKAETSAEGAPAAFAKGAMAVAALRMRPEVERVERSSLRRRRKLAVSEGEMVLQPTPWLFGYSQLRPDYLAPRDAAW